MPSASWSLLPFAREGPAWLRLAPAPACRALAGSPRADHGLQSRESSPGPPGQSRGDPAPLPAWCGLAASLSARGFAARRGWSYPSAPARQRPSVATCRSSHVIGVDVFTETFDFQLRVLEGGQTWVLRLLPVPPAGQVTVLLVTCLTRLRGGPGSAAGGQLARARRHQARSTLCPGLSPRPADPR